MIFIKKFVCLINDNQNSLGLELFCFDCKFTSVELINRSYFDVYEENINFVKNEINRILEKLEINKAQCIVGLNSSIVFSESINLPKLNSVEENKSCLLKLQKYYKEDFEKNYIYSFDKVNINKNNRRINCLLVQKSKYKELLQKIYSLGLGIEKVIFIPVAISLFNAKKHTFGIDKVGLSISVNKNSTMLVVSKNGHLLDYIVSNVGFNSVLNKIAEKKECKVEEIIDSSLSNLSSEEESLIDEFIQFVIKMIKELGFVKDFPITEFYIHSEVGFTDYLKQKLKGILDIKFNQGLKLDSVTASSYQAVSVLKCNSSVLPVRVK